MVRLVDLDQEDGSNPDPNSLIHQVGRPATPTPTTEDDRPNPNVGSFSAALACYPIASQLASYLDLNSLHELSRTCRQFRANLLQYRSQLVAQSMRCENEFADHAHLLANCFRSSRDAWTTYGRTGQKIDRITSGKVGACARDMVGECRKCNRAVCRNCIVKNAAPAVIKARHRRLCATCMKCDVDHLTRSTAERGLELLSFHSPFTDSGYSETLASQSPIEEGDESHKVFVRSPCTCAEQVWICQPCGQTARANDTTYLRGWTWRGRYSTCGGIGAGIGEGLEGVKCGRGSGCLAAVKIYKEIECDADELANFEAEMEKAELDGRPRSGSSYTTQEIVGIGGKVKIKAKKSVLVGAEVREYEDERATGKFMVREQTGQNRSWCCWCERVVLSMRDIDGKLGCL
ncbi:hypothetical protein MBLNU230_g3862t1 [Neophaeotheca triangularis]